jgi:hypothetical protein
VGKNPTHRLAWALQRLLKISTCSRGKQTHTHTQTNTHTHTTHTHTHTHIHTHTDPNGKYRWK